ncbi:hypothetical protein MPSEU_000580700 [Mayamaea pseudoterrestris]|nr:hypothetical protein MPSEU_000580700 [Mayamaea pseudoterrestris]
MPKRGNKRRKKRTHVNDNVNEAGQSALATKDDKIPRSLIMRRGRTAAEVAELVDDLRHLMLPYTALQFQEDPKNRKLSLAQYATAFALPMGVSHLMSFSQNEDRLNLRLARTPDGPTLSFRVHKFSLNRHIKSLQKRPVSYTAALQANPPIVVTNNFGNDAAANAPVAPHVKLLRVTFQNLFPAINVATVKLVECRRVVLFDYVDVPDEHDATKTIRMVEMRHYAVKATPVGVNKRVRRLVTSTKKLPNLNKCSDVSDFIAGTSGFVSDAPSDSEPEDGAQQHVTLPDRYVGKGNNKAQKSALKLVEIGPRLTMELIKVEKGLGGGDVLYHALVHKTPEQAMEIKNKKHQEIHLKEERKAIQQRNVDRKRKALEEKMAVKKQRKLAKEEERMERLRNGTSGGDDGIDDVEDKNGSASGSGDDESDANSGSEDSASDEEVPLN